MKMKKKKKKKKGRKRKNERGEAFENESIREKREERRGCIIVSGEN